MGAMPHPSLPAPAPSLVPVWLRKPITPRLPVPRQRHRGRCATARACSYRKADTAEYSPGRARPASAAAKARGATRRHSPVALRCFSSRFSPRWKFCDLPAAHRERHVGAQSVAAPPPVPVPRSEHRPCSTARRGVGQQPFHHALALPRPAHRYFAISAGTAAPESAVYKQRLHNAAYLYNSFLTCDGSNPRFRFAKSILIFDSIKYN